MKFSTTTTFFFTAALATVSLFGDTLALTARNPQPATGIDRLYAERQASRQFVAAKQVARKQGLSKRQPAPSPVFGPCGILLGGQFVVRVVSIEAGGPFTAASPGYLSVSPDDPFSDGLPYLRATSLISNAQIFSLETTALADCTLVNVSEGEDAAVLADPQTAGPNGSSVVVVGDQAAVAESGFGFVPHVCRADTTGGLTCNLINEDTTVFQLYAEMSSAGLQSGLIGSCFGVCNRSPRNQLRRTVTFSIIPV